MACHGIRCVSFEVRYGRSALLDETGFHVRFM